RAEVLVVDRVDLGRIGADADRAEAERIGRLDDAIHVLAAAADGGLGGDRTSVDDFFRCAARRFGFDGARLARDRLGGLAVWLGRRFRARAFRGDRRRDFLAARSNGRRR